MADLTVQSKDIFNIEEMTFTGGSKTDLHFDFFFENLSTPLNITTSQVIWTLSRFGDLSHTLLRINGVLAGDYACKVTIPSDSSRTLKGKFVQQITIIDYKGNEYVPARGIIKINQNNNNY